MKYIKSLLKNSYIILVFMNTLIYSSNKILNDVLKERRKLLKQYEELNLQQLKELTNKLFALKDQTNEDFIQNKVQVINEIKNEIHITEVGETRMVNLIKMANFNDKDIKEMRNKLGLMYKKKLSTLEMYKKSLIILEDTNSPEEIHQKLTNLENSYSENSYSENF